MGKISLQRKPTRKGLDAIYRQEIIQNVTLFTSQSAAVFYDKLFSSLDFTLPRAATGMFNILLQANPFLDTAPRFLL